MTSRKKSEEEEESGHVQRLARSNAQTCFGLAEKIIDEMLHCKGTASDPTEGNYQVIYRGIHLSSKDGGERKIPAASLLASAIVSNQLHAKGKSPVSGMGAIVGKNVFCCIDVFDPGLVDRHKAKADLRRLKRTFEERPDPFFCAPGR